MHQDLHSGNILIGDNYNYIADLGLCRLANERNKKKVYGVLPYIAPEILLGEPYTQAADIYSFGIVAYELLANSYPYADLKLDDTSLAFKICNGLRPKINRLKIPRLLKDLIKKCWDKNPTERPKKELFININRWWLEIGETIENNVEFASQVQEIEEEYSHWSQNTPYYIYCNMVTTSRPINTKEIVQLFQKSKKRALEQELKKIEKEISQPLTEEQKELISDCIQLRKIITKDKENEKAEDKVWKLEANLKEKGHSRENIEKITRYCESFVKKETELEQLWANVEVPTNK